MAFLLCIKYPRYIPASYWIAEGLIIKEHYALTIIKPKIFIISGSNSIFGICTPLLKEKTNREIINLGLIAPLPFKLYFAVIKRNAKPNDIVLMPMEYYYFIRNEREINSESLHNLTTWGMPFLNEFSIIEKLQLTIQSIPSLPQRIKNYNKNFPIRTYEEYMQNKNQKAILANKNPYANAINYWGDHLLDLPTTDSWDKSNEKYFTANKLKNDHFMLLKNFSDFLAKQNIKLILTYPTSIQKSDFDLSKKEHLSKIIAFNNKIKEHGLTIIGIPELSNFEQIYAFDSPYHLNAEGAILRSLYLADTINCYLAGKPQEISNMEEYKNEKKAEAKIILEEYRKLGYFSE